MDNKLSELSKPVQIFKHPSGRNFWAVMADSTAGQNGVESFYSQGYVSALLAELEAKDRRIADLEAGLLNSHHRLINTTQNCSDWERKAISNFDECANMSQRIEELEEQNTQLKKELQNEGAVNAHAYERIRGLEAKLATPVRLLGEMLVHDWEHSVERQAAFEHRKTAWDARLEEDKKAISSAGFTFTVEGDE